MVYMTIHVIWASPPSSLGGHRGRLRLLRFPSCLGLHVVDEVGLPYDSHAWYIAPSPNITHLRLTLLLVVDGLLVGFVSFLG